MQSRKCRTIIGSGISSFGWLFLTGSLCLLTSLMQAEAAVLCACPCTLAWDLSDDPLVAGYALYYGVSGSTGTNRLDVGLTNQVTLKSLSAGSKYFFFVAAYNVSGLEGLPSVLMYYTPPVLSALKVAPLKDGTLNIRFQAATGAVCHVEYSPSLNPPHWQTLGGSTADTNGCVTINDPLTNKPPARFYRAVVP